jgi:hypothetical protein
LVWVTVGVIAGELLLTRGAVLSTSANLPAMNSTGGLFAVTGLLEGETFEMRGDILATRGLTGGEVLAATFVLGGSSVVAAVPWLGGSVGEDGADDGGDDRGEAGAETALVTGEFDDEDDDDDDDDDKVVAPFFDGFPAFGAAK